MAQETMEDPQSSPLPPLPQVQQSTSDEVITLIDGLNSSSESSRKFAVFKLQGLLGDPGFAEAFIHGGGLGPLKSAVMDTSGNTQAYALGSLDALLELDMGWSVVDRDIVHKAVELATAHPLVNTVRNVLTLLVLIVSKPLDRTAPEDDTTWFGLRAIKPVLEKSPQFIESLVQRLSASDHTLCANALRLVNALMRDAVLHSTEQEWSKFIKKLQDLGVIGSVGMLMRGEAAGDVESPLASAILNFQSLTKVLLRRWKETEVNKELPEHKRALKTMHLLSKPTPYEPEEDEDGKLVGKSKHHPEKWRRLGFETEMPVVEFEETGYLGLMDFVDYARRNQDAYQKILMEQSANPREQRCPLARASLSVTLILYELFAVDDSTDLEDPGYSMDDHVDPDTDVDLVYRPFLLQWGRLHTAAFHAFLRLWQVAGAVDPDDYYKMEEVIRIVVGRIVGDASRKTDIGTIEEELRNVTLETARRWQMEGYDHVYEDAWGPHLVQVREQLHHESLQFMKEQRVRCLLRGSWFPAMPGIAGRHGLWRYVRLSHNRRWLHYQNYPCRGDDEPPLDELPQTIDLESVTSVDSTVSASGTPIVNGIGGDDDDTNTNPRDSSTLLPDSKSHTTNTCITIFGKPSTAMASPVPHAGNVLPPPPPPPGTDPNADPILLELYPQSSHHASEWLDGMLMLLDQQPITKATTRTIDMMEDWGVRLRMLNLRWDDVDWEALEVRVRGDGEEPPPREVPGREGLEGEEYYYAMPEN